MQFSRKWGGEGVIEHSKQKSLAIVLLHDQLELAGVPWHKYKLKLMSTVKVPSLKTVML